MSFYRMRSKIVFSPTDRSFSDIYFEELPADSIDLNYHVSTIGESQSWTQKDLDSLVSKLYLEDMDFEKPLWRFFIINGMADGRHMLLVVVDHSIGDGASLMNILLSMVDEIDGRPLSHQSVIPRRREQTKDPFLLRRLAVIAEGTIRGVIAATFPPDPPNPLKLAEFRDAMSERRCATTAKICLAEVKAVRSERSPWWIRNAVCPAGVTEIASPAKESREAARPPTCPCGPRSPSLRRRRDGMQSACAVGVHMMACYGPSCPWSRVVKGLGS